MGAHRIAILLMIVVASAPLASAIDPFYDPLCVNAEMCAGAGSCLVAWCIPPGCAPVASCHGEIGPDSAECAQNATIDGRTCQAHFGVSVRGAGATSTGARVQTSNGSVDARHLENAWISPGVEGEAAPLGLDLGGVHLYAYSSNIRTEGPRGGPYGAIAPDHEHTWTQIGIVVGHSGGPLFGEQLVVAVELLDLMPEGCWARAPRGGFVDVTCPSLAPLHP